MDLPEPALGGLHAHPEAKEKSGLYCFQDNGRECNADCMAYQTPPTDAEYQGKQWAHCVVLTAMHRGSKHLVIIASALKPSRPGEHIQPIPPR